MGNDIYSVKVVPWKEMFGGDELEPHKIIIRHFTELDEASESIIPGFSQYVRETILGLRHEYIFNTIEQLEQFKLICERRDKNWCEKKNTRFYVVDEESLKGDYPIPKFERIDQKDIKMFREMTQKQLENTIRHMTESTSKLLQKFNDKTEETSDYVEAMNDIEESLILVRRAYEDYSYSRKGENDRKINVNELPISAQIDYIDDEHFAFVTPPLMNKRHGTKARVFAKTLAESIRELSYQYKIKKKKNRVVEIHHVRHRNKAHPDCDNMEVRDILNGLVDCVLTDDSLDCMRLIHTQELIENDMEEFTEIRIYPMEELKLTDKFS